MSYRIYAVATIQSFIRSRCLASSLVIGVSPIFIFIGFIYSILYFLMCAWYLTQISVHAITNCCYLFRSLTVPLKLSYRTLQLLPSFVKTAHEIRRYLFSLLNFAFMISFCFISLIKSCLSTCSFARLCWYCSISCRRAAAYS